MPVSLNKLTAVAAQVGCAPGVVAQDGGSVCHGGAIVRARVVPAERFAALCHITRVIVALRVFGAVDGSVAVRAAD